jgi:pimeloyl-ACP methyl ester carboxylesterase
VDRARSADGTALAFDRVGGGPPLVLVGGALSDRGAAAPISAQLGRGFTVFAYDRRGRGDSGDTPPYAVAREIEDLAAMIEAAGGSAFVYGHSSGAVLALRAAAVGLSIRKLVAYEPPFIVDDSRPPVPDDYVEHLDALVAEGRPGDAVAYFMTTGVGLPAGIVEQMRGAPMWPAFESVAHTLGYDGRIMADTLRGRPLAGRPWSDVKIPTLVMDGGASPPSQRAGARALADVLPDARYRTLQGQDHGPVPEMLAPAITDFLLG